MGDHTTPVVFFPNARDAESSPRNSCQEMLDWFEELVHVDIGHHYDGEDDERCYDGFT